MIARMQEFDPSDDYHRDDIHAPGYHAAIDRCIRLIRGEIESWTDPR